MEVNNESRIYDGFPIATEINKPVEFDGVRFVYTGSSTPEVDGINCDNVLPRAINSTSGHHQPIIVNYDGYFKINETRHFIATFPDGQVKSLTVCWIGHTMPKVIQMCENLSCGGMFCPSETSWFDSNKTAGIIQGERCTPNGPYYDKYVAEKNDKS
jgi:hypothetical protein